MRTLVSAALDVPEAARLVAPMLRRAQEATCDELEHRWRLLSDDQRRHALGLLSRFDPAILTPWMTRVLPLLKHAQAPVRRGAARVLKKIAVAEAGPELRDALFIESDGSSRRALMEAIAASGHPDAPSWIASIQPRAQDSPTARVHQRATTHARRDALRAVSSKTIPLSKLCAVETKGILLTCKRGFEQLLHDDLARRGWSSELRSSAVSLRASPRPLRELFDCRLFDSIEFPLAPKPRLVDAVTEMIPTLEALTPDRPVRYRLDAPGRARGWIRGEAQAIDAAFPQLLNDPKEAPWTLRIQGPAPNVLVPRVEDPRFLYRVGDVPAASHPTVAAALATLASPTPEDLVWDPFMGSGLELCEVARIEPRAHLLGSDLDPRAVRIAQRNLTNAGARAGDLRVGDACIVDLPAAPTCVVTNPPLGKRVKGQSYLPRFFQRFLDHFAKIAAPKCRLVWLSPVPSDTRRLLEGLRFSVRKEFPVDLGGVRGSVQVAVRTARA